VDAVRLLLEHGADADATTRMGETALGCNSININVNNNNAWIYTHTHAHTRTHTHARAFNGHFSGTTRVSRYQKGKTNLDFTEARDSEWQWHQLGRMQICT